MDQWTTGLPFHTPQQPSQQHQAPSDAIPRFFATPDERARYLSTPNANPNFDTTYPDSFISVIIDGNRLQFLDTFVAQDELGGRQAAMALTHAIGESLHRMGYAVTKLLVRVLGDPEWLADAYLDAGVIPSRMNFGWFLRGFNGVESLVEFVPVDDRSPSLGYRSRDAPSILAINLLDPHSACILYGALLSDATTQLLTANHPATTNNRLLVFSTTSSLPNPPTTLPQIPRIPLPTIFRPLPHRPHSPYPHLSPTIPRNAAGQRIDPPLHPKETLVTYLRKQKYCNNHFLLGECIDPYCKAKHEGRLDGEMLEGLRYLGRSLPCRSGNRCRDEGCYAGHMCPFVECGNPRCRFWGEAHVRDRVVINGG